MNRMSQVDSIDARCWEEEWRWWTVCCVWYWEQQRLRRETPVRYRMLVYQSIIFWSVSCNDASWLAARSNPSRSSFIISFSVVILFFPFPFNRFFFFFLVILSLCSNAVDRRLERNRYLKKGRVHGRRRWRWRSWQTTCGGGGGGRKRGQWGADGKGGGGGFWGSQMVDITRKQLTPKRDSQWFINPEYRRGFLKLGRLDLLLFYSDTFS